MVPFMFHNRLLLSSSEAIKDIRVLRSCKLHPSPIFIAPLPHITIPIVGGLIEGDNKAIGQIRSHFKLVISSLPSEKRNHTVARQSRKVFPPKLGLSQKVQTQMVHRRLALAPHSLDPKLSFITFLRRSKKEKRRGEREGRGGLWGGP